jgi:putative Mg2+ transporter-C (MgtC) family protein
MCHSLALQSATIPNGMHGIEWAQIARDLEKILMAYLLALPVGWEREKEEHSAGIRTFPLVAMASCGFVLLGVTLSGDGRDAQSRIIQGLITGIGFIGGGAILKSDGGVHGTATAASIWVTGVIGAAVAVARYDIAIGLSLLNLVTLRLLYPLKKRLDNRPGEPQ